MIDSANANRNFLDVPYADRELAKSAGARWDRSANRWYAPAGALPSALLQWEPRQAETVAAPPGPVERAFALYVPFDQREKVKALGAVYDSEVKVWFAPKGEAEAPLSDWRVTPPVFVGAGDPQEAFAMALLEAGIDEPAPVMDGVMRRAPLIGGRPNKQDGAYIGHLDGKPSGYILNHKTKHEARWTMAAAGNQPREAASTGRCAAYRAQIQLEASARAAERERVREAVAEASRAKWQSLSDESLDTNPYLARKGVGGHGVRRSGEDLVIPLRDIEGKLWSLQTIKATDGAPKLFEKNGRKMGCFHVLGELVDGRDFLVAEGYATAATLFESTRMPVVVAFDAGNLLPVAKALAKKFTRSFFMVMGDDDRHGPEGSANTGAIKANEAASAVGAGFALPSFASLDEKPTDFNDLGRLEGASRVFELVNTALFEQKRTARASLRDTLAEQYPGAIVYHAGVWKDSRQSGKICAQAPGLVALISGPAKGGQYVSIHEAAALDGPLSIGERVTITYKNKSASCVASQRNHSASLELGG